MAADILDVASEYEENQREMALAQARANAAKLTITGRCYNCEEEVGQQLFCDVDCREDFEFRDRMQKTNFRI
jgi:hypothetical protein